MLPARGLCYNQTGPAEYNVHSTVSTQQISDGRFTRKKGSIWYSQSAHIFVY